MQEDSYDKLEKSEEKLFRTCDVQEKRERLCNGPLQYKKKSLLSYLKTEIFGHKNQSLNISLSSFKVILRRYLEHEVPQCKSFHQDMSGYAPNIMGCKLLLNLGFCEIEKLLWQFLKNPASTECNLSAMITWISF